MSIEQISAQLHALRPGAVWIVRGTSYSDIEWLDLAQTIPTALELGL